MLILSIVNQNLNLEAKIVRRPSRIMLKQKKSEAPTPGGLLAPPVVPGLPGTPAGSHSALLSPSVPSLSTSLGPSSSFGPQSFLKIHVGADSVHVASTIPVYVHFSDLVVVALTQPICDTGHQACICRRF
jgi:target of rapamycin complex 2 subunit MAPKAP1